MIFSLFSPLILVRRSNVNLKLYRYANNTQNYSICVHDSTYADGNKNKKFSSDNENHINI